MSASKYSFEFKERVVADVVEASRPVAGVAKSHGLAPQTVNNWVDNRRKRQSDADVEEAALDLSAENECLRAELREAKMELEFLKKAAAFFSREP
jgi:transposase IS3/IS911 family protein